MSHPSGGLRIEQREGHVRVTYSPTDTMTDPRIARACCAAVDEVLRRSGLRAVLFDTRESADPSEEAREAYWVWARARAHHDRVALVVRSDLKKVRGNMTARALSAPLRSFDDVDQAEAWLRGK